MAAIIPTGRLSVSLSLAVVVVRCCHYEVSILAAGVKAPSFQGDGFSAK